MTISDGTSFQDTLLPLANGPPMTSRRLIIRCREEDVNCGSVRAQTKLSLCVRAPWNTYRKGIMDASSIWPLVVVCARMNVYRLFYMMLQIDVVIPHVGIMVQRCDNCCALMNWPIIPITMFFFLFFFAKDMYSSSSIQSFRVERMNWIIAKFYLTPPAGVLKHLLEKGCKVVPSCTRLYASICNKTHMATSLICR